MEKILYFQNEIKKKGVKQKGVISIRVFNIKAFFIYTKMQSTCLLKVLVIACLQSHKISIVYQLFSSKLALYKDFSCYFYFPMCYFE